MGTENNQAFRKTQDKNGIAIIGVSLRFPKSDNLDELWDHLQSESCLITEIPSNRWEKEKFFGDPKSEANKTNSVWGGFIDDADCFDASFFHVSPREATTMDPQQRIALELAWKAIEDAGYKASSLKSTKTGVFMGVCNTDYTELIEKNVQEVDAYIPTGTSNAIISNRISYWFDFYGPSITLDTACASSLVAIHQAVRSLENEECDYAMAGGVNICWSPRRFIALSQGGMLSKEGRSRAFDERADGYVRAEGGAILLLKPLDKAVEDQDHIYAVIKGVGTNHGGRTNSLTITNPKAHAELIADLYEKAGISPDSVSYIETHGPGTPLGDPIEIHGLKMAFQQLCKKFDKKMEPSTCGLGSVKTNIGHLESAAGIAGVLKVIASMKNKTLPACVQFEQLNPVINMSDSPFYIVNKTKSWEVNHHSSTPRRAGVSSFGFGGSNAHIILEEYIPSRIEESDHMEIHNTDDKLLIPLSAKNPERLNEYVRVYVEHIKRIWPVEQAEAQSGSQDEKRRLRNLAYTLQVGREAMDERVIFVAGDTQELIAQMEAFLQGNKLHANCWKGNIKQGKEIVNFLAEDEDLQELVHNWGARGKVGKIAELWVKGYPIDWKTLDARNGVQRVSLPTYPFARERYWISGMKREASRAKISQDAAPTPLLQQEYVPSRPPAVQPATNSELSDSHLSKENVALPPSHSDQTAAAPIMHPSVGPNLRTRQLITLSPASMILPQSELDSVCKPDSTRQSDISLNTLQIELATSLAEVLYVDKNDIDIDKKFIDVGLDSIIAVEWIRVINKQHGTSISATIVYDYPTIREFARYLENEVNGQGIQAAESILPTRRPINLLPVSVVLQQGGHDNEIKSTIAEHKGISLDILQKELVTSLADVLYVDQKDIDVDNKFIDVGLDSIIAVEWMRGINKRYGTAMNATMVYDHPTLREFASFLEKELNGSEAGSHQASTSRGSDHFLDEVLEQVYQGTIDLDKAEQVLHEFNLFPTVR
ncbi:type I polyketide synthase [Paenibacillus hexagrammi]|uniref:Phosphopantetheine-binding protein n=1 Tax=Paenibacillus hexagrammi TaxID=2908839 RepID=A0ABY3SNV7_9BACL|nr:beta-ketoacyl synthase N-terminal-like domain-containing protein [Paenibacillus sp. YPD9-1]UJF34786.1 phosphopantetheine-binding protein [Paenibacillus sp. YPD9-1]